jgi:rhodanese-related sulfurtransferase
MYLQGILLWLNLKVTESKWYVIFFERYFIKKAILEKYDKVTKGLLRDRIFTIEDYRRALRKRRKFVFVDVREAHEYKVSRISGAIPKDVFERNYAKYSGHAVIFYCTIGLRSIYYLESLQKEEKYEGMEFYNLAGALLLWIVEDMAIVNDGGVTNVIDVHKVDWNIIPNSYRVSNVNRSFEISELKYKLDGIYLKARQNFIGIPEVNVLNCMELEKKDKEVVYVDVREKYEYDVSRIPKALFVGDFEKVIAKDPDKFKDKVLIFYCTVGFRSGKYLKKYADEHAVAGHEMYNLEGSILQWVANDFPLEDDKGQSKSVHTHKSQWGLVPSDYNAVYQN